MPFKEKVTVIRRPFRNSRKAHIDEVLQRMLSFSNVGGKIRIMLRYSFIGNASEMFLKMRMFAF